VLRVVPGKGRAWTLEQAPSGRLRASNGAASTRGDVHRDSARAWAEQASHLNVSWGSDIAQVRSRDGRSFNLGLQARDPPQPVCLQQIPTPRNRILEVRRSGHLLPDPFAHDESLPIQSESSASASGRRQGGGREEGTPSATRTSAMSTAHAPLGDATSAVALEFPSPASLSSHGRLQASILASPDPATITKPVRKGNEALIVPSSTDSHFKFLQKARSQLETMLDGKRSGAGGSNEASGDRPRVRSFCASDGKSDDDRPQLVNTMQDTLKVRTILEASLDDSELLPRPSLSFLAKMGHDKAEATSAEGAHDRGWDRHRDDMQGDREQERKERAEEREALALVHDWIKRADESWSYHSERMCTQVLRQTIDLFITQG
jgi:hypothetical protein